MSNLHFSLTLSGTVSPNGGNEEANQDAMTASELRHNLAQAISHITGEGLVTGHSPATLEEYAEAIHVSTVKTEMMAMPIISTAHLDSGTAQWLSDRGDLCNWATVAPYQEGFFVWFLDACQDQMPQSAKDVLLWLKREELGAWVRFDRDGETVDGLPVYDW